MQFLEALRRSGGLPQLVYGQRLIVSRSRWALAVLQDVEATVVGDDTMPLLSIGQRLDLDGQVRIYATPARLTEATADRLARLPADALVLDVAMVPETRQPSTRTDGA